MPASVSVDRRISKLLGDIAELQALIFKLEGVSRKKSPLYTSSHNPAVLPTTASLATRSSTGLAVMTMRSLSPWPKAHLGLVEPGVQADREFRLDAPECGWRTRRRRVAIG